MPSAAMPAIVGRMISCITRACTFGVTTGAGEYAPMPPVFGPVSPSPRRLWSWLVASASTLRAVADDHEARFLAVEELLDHDAAAAGAARRRASRRSPACASARVAATTTPLPAARPSALTTIGAPRRVDVAHAPQPHRRTPS